MDENTKKEMLDVEEILGNKAELLEGIPQYISSETEVLEQKLLSGEQDDEYISIYSGKALKPEELFQFSTKEDVNMVLIAGPYASGKTTLIVMLYRLFLEGYNSRLCFAGSNTMEGFRERSVNLLYKSGQAEPSVSRTSRAAEDWYLHLAVSDMEGRKQNLFFADVSGEKFSDCSGVELIAEYFSDSENVIVVVDGEKVCDVAKRNGEIFATDMLLKRLLNRKILSKRTKLQIVFTKIDLCKNRESAIKYIQEKELAFINKFEPYVCSVKCLHISALSEEPEECKKLEQILQNCMEIVPLECDSDLQSMEYNVIRNFDKFQVRESVQYV